LRIWRKYNPSKFSCNFLNFKFAKICNFVIGIDIDPTRTFYAKHNAQIYQVSEKIDFLTADFLKLKNLSGDVVFLAPSVIQRDAKEKFSLYKHLEPDLRHLLAKSLEISHCISIKLPAETDLEEMAGFFNSSLEFYELYKKYIFSNLIDIPRDFALKLKRSSTMMTKWSVL
jgi:23S rRNA G2445 N2-methylase RlmL